MKKTNRNDLYIMLFSLPLYFTATVKYGLRVPLVLLSSIILGFVVESLSNKIQKIEQKNFGVVSWFLMPLVFAPAMPLWMVLVSMFLALIIAVIFFGGHGHQMFSPVALAWAFGSLSFTRPLTLSWVLPYPGFEIFKNFKAAMVPLMEHPLDFLALKGTIPLDSMLLGDFPQPLSNAMPIVTICCGVLLVLVRAVDFKTIISYLGTLLCLFIIFESFSQVATLDTLLVGNIIFAAFFILPNRRLASRTYGGRWVMGIMAGILTFVIRSFSGFPDGVLYAVLLTNIFSALVDEAVIAGKFKGVSNENS